MIISDYIAKIIEQMLDESGGIAEVKRNDLAARIGCVPSQINYVITSRFTPERGYIIESRRGGGGYIRIERARMSENEYLMHFFQAVGQEIESSEAKAYIKNLLDNEIISKREAAIINSAITENALDKISSDIRNMVRADIMRHVLMTLMN